MDTWGQEGQDVFMRSVYVNDNRSFTRTDFRNCLTLLRKEHGIRLDPQNPQQCHYASGEMTFIISDGDMKRLREKGLGIEDAGTLAGPLHAKLNPRTKKNEPDAVLAVQMRTHLMQRKNWSDEERAHILSGDLHADLMLPKTFIENLAHAHGVDSLTNSAITEMLKTAWRSNFPDVSTPAIGTMDTKNGVVFTFVVPSKDIPQLEEVIMEAQHRRPTLQSDGERPTATITSISAARRPFGASTQR